MAMAIALVLIVMALSCLQCGTQRDDEHQLESECVSAGAVGDCQQDEHTGGSHRKTVTVAFDSEEAAGMDGSVESLNRFGDHMCFFSLFSCVNA